MRVLVLLISVFATTAFRLRKPAIAAQNATAPRNQTEGGSAALTKKLDALVGGLDNIYAVQSKSVTGPSRFGEMLKPFLSQMHAVLQEVKTNKTLTEAQKLEKLHVAEASLDGLKKDMAKLTTNIKEEGDEDKQSILMGVLMSRKNRPVEEQLEVLQDKQFKDLEVVQYVLAHRDQNKSLAEQVAAHLDATSHGKPHVSAPQDSLAAVTGPIVSKLESFLANMEKHLAEQERMHQKVLKEQEEELRNAKKKMASFKGKDANLKNSTMNEEKHQVARAEKILRRRMKKEETVYSKQHKLLAKDVDALKSSIEAVKKGDMKQLAKMQQVLQDSMKAMQGKDDFLHFMQMSAWTSEERGCPYCKAQCLEKCHNGGKSFMECMTACDSVGN